MAIRRRYRLSYRNSDFILRKMQTSQNKLVEWCDLNGFKVSIEDEVKQTTPYYLRRKKRKQNNIKI